MPHADSKEAMEATAPSHISGGHLLLLGCSGRKRSVGAASPAIDLYDGVNFRVLRAFLHRNGWPAGLVVKVVSAKLGLIDGTELIEPYEKRLDLASAKWVNGQVLEALTDFGQPRSVFVNMGKAYLRAIAGIDRVFSGSRIIYPPGGIGRKMGAMKKWLESLPRDIARIPGVRSNRPYLYFFPDWDDYVTEPFVHETRGNGRVVPTKRRYAHEVFGPETPYDGMLVSLAQLHTTKGSLSRMSADSVAEGELRDVMKMPKHLLLFGDSGAFSYASETDPPFTPEEAARLYDRFGFDIGASVDHIPLADVVGLDEDGKRTKLVLTEEERQRRMQLTATNADAFLTAHREQGYDFVPMGVIQGINVASYVGYVHEYLDMGYRHIALGGLVPKQDREILALCCAVREAIQSRTRAEEQNVWLHLFGILRPKIQQRFRLLGVSSFDSASYLRKAWLRSDQNYLASDGSRWYGSIRVPISSSKRVRMGAEDRGIGETELSEMETRCLKALRRFDGSPETHEEVIEAINEYGPLLARRGEDNHFFEKHSRLLSDRPWESCRCPVCRQLGIDVVVFRGTGRNKRRGFHNTWVFYHKILHGRNDHGGEA